MRIQVYAFLIGFFLSISLGSLIQSEIKQAQAQFTDSHLDSADLADSPTNTDCLKSDGTDNYWETCGGAGGSTLHVDGGGYVYPQTGDYHSAPYYTATSTTVASTFVNASTTLLSVSGDTWLSGNLTVDSSTGTSTFNGAVTFSTTTSQHSDGNDLVFPENVTLLFEGDPLTANINGGLEFYADTNNTKWAQKWYGDEGNIFGYITMHEHNPDDPHFSVEVPATKGGSPNSVFTVDSWCDGSTDDACGVDVTTGHNLYVTSGKSRFGGTVYTDAGVKVGIGTSTPETLLEIGRNGNIPEMTLRQTATAINEATNPWLGSMYFAGNDKFSGENGYGAEIRARAGGIWNGTTNDYPTDLSFWTTPNGSGALAERLTILSDGNVGISTSSPEAKLDVWGSSGGKIMTLFSDAGTKFMEMLNTGVTTLLGTWDFGGATVTGLPSTPAFTYSTSTAWTGTTTISLGVAFNAETWDSVKCYTDTGTVNVSFTDGTNRMNLFNASTTVGTVVLSTNNSFTSSEKRYVDIGTPASTPTEVSCTVSKQDD